jgi:hypothetical protein
MFLRGQQDLAHRIQRLKTKGTGCQETNCKGLDPSNFYKMPFLPEGQMQESRQLKTPTIPSIIQKACDTGGPLIIKRSCAPTCRRMNQSAADINFRQNQDAITMSRLMESMRSATASRNLQFAKARISLACGLPHGRFLNYNGANNFPENILSAQSSLRGNFTRGGTTLPGSYGVVPFIDHNTVVGVETSAIVRLALAKHICQRSTIPKAESLYLK